MKIDAAEVHGLYSSIKASKYPMSINIEELTNDITPTVKKLANSKAGEGHDQFLTGITVNFDLKASKTFWIEAQRYTFLNFVSSQSTMHRISDFDLIDQFNDYVDERIIRIIIELRDKFLETQTPIDKLCLLYSLPSGFELTARMTTNYRQLKTIYIQRKNHQLPEWKIFCAWIRTLPESSLITGEPSISLDEYYRLKKGYLEWQ